LDAPEDELVRSWKVALADDYGAQVHEEDRDCDFAVTDESAAWAIGMSERQELGIDLHHQ
jgi:hypothetical protein